MRIFCQYLEHTDYEEKSILWSLIRDILYQHLLILCEQGTEQQPDEHRWLV